MKNYNVAVVGATGAVGEEMLNILEEKDFPINKLKLFATEKSKGKKIMFKDEEFIVDTIKPGSFEDIDIALFSISSSASKNIAPKAADEGAIVIDNSNAFRMDDNVPLVVPEINPDEIFNNQGIIANPNCSTIQMVLALKPIYEEAGIEQIIVSTYQAVSGTGRDAINELTQQTENLMKNKDIKSEVYPHQIAFNALPHIDIFFDNGYTKEEMKMVREPRKIFDDPELKISATAVRIPVYYGHAEAINLVPEKNISIEKLKDLLASTEGVKIVDNPDKNEYPLSIMSENDDSVMVGRIRKDLVNEKGINMWVVANNLRKGAALNAVQIAEQLIKKI